MKFPSEWLSVRLKDVITDMQPGFAQRPGDDGTIPQIRTHNISPQGQIDLNGLKFVNPSTVELEHYSLQPGDVIFNNTNSEEWVGKTAVFKEKGNYVFSNHMTRIRVDTSLISPDFLAYYLHFLWKSGFSKQKAKRWVSQAGIDQSALQEFIVPIPTLPEQRHIVDMLNQVARLCFLRNEGNSQINKLRFKLFYDFFGELNAKSSRWQNTAICQVSKISYGLPEKLDNSLTRKDGYRILTISNVTKEGYFDLSVERFVPIDKEKIPAVNVEKNDLLFNWRSGSPEHVGKTAIWETDNDDPLLHVSFLLKIRPNRELVDPYYLWVLLNLIRKIGFFSKSGRKQVNTKFNATELGKLKIPVPPLVLQKEFSTQIRQLQETRTKLYQSTSDLFNFKGDITISAFTGELTQLWRKANRNELEATAAERDAALGITKKKIIIKVHAPEERPWLSQPNRHWLMDQLSEFQGFIYEALREWKGTLIPSEDLEAFREQAFPVEHLEDANDQILRALHQLAGLGLIAKISLYNYEGDYVTAFRGLREEELSQVSDRQYLAKG